MPSFWAQMKFRIATTPSPTAGWAPALRSPCATSRPASSQATCWYLPPSRPKPGPPKHLNGCPTLTLEHLRRRLLNGIGPNLQAVVFKFQAGSGTVHALRHRSTTASTPMAHPPAATSPTGQRVIAGHSTVTRQCAGAFSPSLSAFTGSTGFSARFSPQTMVCLRSKVRH